MHGAGQWHFSNTILVKNAPNGYPTKARKAAKTAGVALGYVDDFDEPRTNPRMGCVLARLGLVGVM